MLSNTVADTERVLGRDLTWWERTGLWWDGWTTARIDAGTGEIAPIVQDSRHGFNGELRGTGAASEWLAGTVWGEQVGDVAKVATDTAQVGTEAIATAARGLGPVGVLAVVGLGVYLWFRGR